VRKKKVRRTEGIEKEGEERKGGRGKERRERKGEEGEERKGGRGKERRERKGEKRRRGMMKGESRTP
jgi:ribonuclease E